MKEIIRRDEIILHLFSQSEKHMYIYYETKFMLMAMHEQLDENHAWTEE